MVKRLALVVAIVAACKTPIVRTDVTGVALDVSFSATIDQLVVVGRHQNGEVIGTQTVKAGASPQRVAIVLNTPTAGEQLRLRVDGLAGGVVVASGAGVATIALETMTAVTITLGAAALCGDGVVQAPLEACDDGALVKGDGCDDECAAEPARCGDGVKAASEACDDGNMIANDGCTACAIDAGYACNGTVCTRLCGNGKLDEGEECDDKNGAALDGCSVTCTREPGYVCMGEPSACALTCGDGDIDAVAGEECDDAGVADDDGCDSSCAVELGWECDGTGAGSCHVSCGDGTIDTGETCDDMNTMSVDGCSSGCMKESGYECVGAGVASCHFSCGDSTLDAGEECDDGDAGGDGCDSDCQIEPTFECDTGVQPSVCNLKCGNGCVDPGETCDFGAPGVCGARPTALAGETCSSLGSRKGGGPGLACNGTCDAFVLTGCTGGVINSEAQIRGAITDAYASVGHEIIAIHPGTYTLTSAIQLNECGGACAPSGVTIRPLSGVVTFATDASTPGLRLFDVYTGKNRLEALSFSVTNQNGTAIYLNAGAEENEISQCTFVRPASAANTGDRFVQIDSNVNLIERNDFTNVGASTAQALVNAVLVDGGIANTIRYNSFLNTAPSGAVSQFVLLRNGGDSNDVTANRFVNAGAGNVAGAAVQVNNIGTDGNIVAMNVIEGPYAAAIEVISADATRIDHNSTYFRATGGSQTPLRFQASTNTCYRNNVIDADATIVMVTSATFASCDGTPTGNNDYVGPDPPCAGAPCATTCSALGSGPVCDLNVAPAFTAGLCTAATGLVDHAVELQCGGVPCYDLVDPLGAPFANGTADIGAREAGSTRIFGVTGPTSCP